MLQHTLGLSPETWRVLSRCHEVRNRSEYSGEFSGNEGLLRDLLAATEIVLKALESLSPPIEQ